MPKKAFFFGAKVLFLFVTAVYVTETSGHVIHTLPSPMVTWYIENPQREFHAFRAKTFNAEARTISVNAQPIQLNSGRSSQGRAA